ncbi:PDZ domain-containing protein [Colwellia psychrerythraea]|uniref:PDZ/DHR/GLGF domain protein n=1 Tax=Colwellia psychrerythraea TaxID=28229 RepID=A0A099KMV6_COLPS|nr:PDZ domain-containing protein [Colwellia psychrerythraea]KGJ92069.1 PDZ/DHR/GLGF domain protein [Colwellia psychrerythraea]
MNTVFNERIALWTKKHGSLILMILLVLGFSTHANAQQCASVGFVSAAENDDGYISLIARHNENNLERVNNRAGIISGEYQYSFGVGKHIVVVEQWPTKVYKKLRENSKIHIRYLPLNLKYQTVLLDVKADHNYQLKVLSSGQKIESIEVNSDIKKLCEAKGKEIFKAFPLLQESNGTESNNPENIKLPAPLEYRLRQLMTKLENSNQSDEFDLLVQSFDGSISTDIGVLTSSDYQNNGDAIEIVSVKPYTLAEQLQLRSGDKITHLGGDRIKADDSSPFKQLKAYFANLYIGERIKITFLRNGKKNKINKRFMPVIVPKINYQIAEKTPSSKTQEIVTEYQALAGINRLELEQLILEIQHYYQDNNYNQDVILISRAEKFDNKIGFSGDKIVFPKSTGLKIFNINEHSFAEKIGLKTLDIIVNINGQDITTDNIEKLISSLTLLKSGDTVSMQIQRGEQLVTLEKTYQPQLLVSFNLSIDLPSIKIATERLEKESYLNRRSMALERRRDAPNDGSSSLH